jgi:hypothetical protein
MWATEDAASGRAARPDDSTSLFFRRDIAELGMPRRLGDE